MKLTINTNADANQNNNLDTCDVGFYLKRWLTGITDQMEPDTN